MWRRLVVPFSPTPGPQDSLWPQGAGWWRWLARRTISSIRTEPCLAQAGLTGTVDKLAHP